MIESISTVADGGWRMAEKRETGSDTISAARIG